MAQLQAGHVFVGRVERALEAFVDLQQPVEVEGVVALAAELLHRLEAGGHLARHFGRVVDDDLIVRLRRFAQGGTDERVQLLQVRRCVFRPGEDDGERQVAVVRVHEEAQQGQELLGRTGAAGEDDDAVADTHEGFQRPFDPTHENMASLQLSHALPPHELAANLRRAFSGIVAGNVKDKGIRLIEQNGPYEIHGDPAIMKPLDELLQAFVAQHRMKLPGGAAYVPCYRVVQ